MTADRVCHQSSESKTSSPICKCAPRSSRRLAGGQLNFRVAPLPLSPASEIPLKEPKEQPFKPSSTRPPGSLRPMNTSRAGDWITRVSPLGSSWRVAVPVKASVEIRPPLLLATRVTQHSELPKAVLKTTRERPRQSETQTKTDTQAEPKHRNTYKGHRKTGRR